MCNNQLVTFPSVALTLPNLTKFHLESNNIDTLPTFIQQMKTLVELNLNSCKISTLDNCPGLGQLSRLRTLHLRDNNVTTLPITLALLHTTLTDLALDTDRMIFPPADVCARGSSHIMRYLKDKLNGMCLRLSSCWCCCCKCINSFLASHSQGILVQVESDSGWIRRSW